MKNQLLLLFESAFLYTPTFSAYKKGTPLGRGALTRGNFSSSDPRFSSAPTGTPVKSRRSRRSPSPLDVPPHNEVASDNDLYADENSQSSSSPPVLRDSPESQHELPADGSQSEVTLSADIISLLGDRLTDNRVLAAPLHQDVS